MRIAHLILAHKAPAQLERLVRALAHPQAACFIHLDRKADSQLFAALPNLPGVYFIGHRLDVRWGGYSLTQAALEGMRQILQAPVRYEVINLLSGEDYPIKPLAVIHDFWARHPGRSFLEYEAADSAWWRANMRRATRYHLTEYSFPGRYVVERILNLLLPRRQPPLPRLYGGNRGGWYTLSRASAEYVVAYVDAHPRLRRYARLTWGSDEFLIPSILLNSPLAATVTNNNMRYVDWSAGGSSPRILTQADLPALRASARLFARKFDAQRDAAVLDALDQANR